MLHGWKDNSMPTKPLAAYQSVVNSFRVIRCSSQCVSPKIAIFTIFVSPGDAPGAIALNVVWMEREFDAYKLSRSMCHLSSTVSHIFEPQCKKSPFSRTASHIFVSPGDAPATITRNMLHGWKDNYSMLVKPLAACTYLSSIVSELYDA